MYKNSEKKLEQIVNLYNEGMLLNDISKATSTSTTTVKKILLSVGIDYNLVKEKDYQERIAKIVPLYKEGKSQLDLEKELRLTRKTIRTILKDSDVEYRDLSKTNRRWRNTEINDNAFDELTEEVLYWIGFLYADGHVTLKGNGIELRLAIKDLNHIEKFKLFLNSNSKIDIAEDYCRIRIYSKPLQDRLKYFGFDNNKSFTATPHEELKNSRHFWRGVVDGDGGVYNYKDELDKKSITNQVFLCGTLDTVFEFIEFINNNISLNTKKYPTKTISRNHYNISYYKEVTQIVNLLYKDSKVYLERKYQKYLEITK